MGRFNLLDERWISVMPVNGNEQINVSLKDIFQNAHAYRTLCGETETQNFAVLRLLEAVIQTVFSRYDVKGSANPYITLDSRMKQTEEADEDDAEDLREFLEDNWKDLWNEGKFPDIVSEYLEAWRDRFCLLDEAHPFYQVNEVTLQNLFPSEKDSNAVIKGNTHGKFMNRLISESEHKTALFSPMPESDGTERDKMTVSEFARWLITFQAYTGLSDKKTLVSKEQKPSRGWLYDLGGLYLEGKNLFETLMLNYIPAYSSTDDYLTSIQRPCWEYDASEVVKKIMLGYRIDNLSELYTNWSRVIYLDPKFDFTDPVCIGIAKLPGLDHQDMFIEPMTIWHYCKTGENKGHSVPVKYEPEQAMWRSFGLITMKNSDEQHRPEIMNQYSRISRIAGNRSIRLHAVSMKDDGNATSWVPVDEVSDQLDLNDMIISDQASDGWIIRINDEVSLTKEVIEKTYRAFLENIKLIRGIEQTDFTKNNIEDAYFAIDRAFRNWLESLMPEDSIEERMIEWKKELKSLMMEQAQQRVNEAGAKDFRGIEKDGRSLNITTAYLRFIWSLNKKLS